MSRLSEFVYAPADVRELDRLAINDAGIAGYELMSRAGQVAFESGLARFTYARHWLVICGAGNNAGDGYVIARLALEAGCEVTTVALADPEKLTGDAATAWQDFIKSGGTTVDFDPVQCPEADLVVDAILGTGLTRPLKGLFLDAVRAICKSGKTVLAVDVPTGLNGLTGEVMGDAVRADLTVSFVGLKQGLFLGRGPELAGEVLFDDLGIPFSAVEHVAPVMRIFQQAELDQLLPKRSREAHKGMFGHVLIVGGNVGMSGAVRMAGEAALRSGAGLVTVATRPDNVAAVTGNRPELMCRGIADPSDLDDLLSRVSVIAIGPGLGQDDWARNLLEYLLQVTQPKVLDADALNLLAQNPQCRNDWILTPHPGEAGRLLGTDTAGVQGARLSAVGALQERYGAAVVLKGQGTLIAGPGHELPVLIRQGNPGMATAGMGDILTGLTAGLLAQCGDQDLTMVAAAAAYVHACSGDIAAQAGERGMIATDLLPHFRTCLNQAS